jgi:hypothetical protein
MGSENDEDGYYRKDSEYFAAVRIGPRKVIVEYVVYYSLGPLDNVCVVARVQYEDKIFVAQVKDTCAIGHATTIDVLLDTVTKQLCSDVFKSKFAT